MAWIFVVRSFITLFATTSLPISDAWSTSPLSFVFRPKSTFSRKRASFCKQRSSLVFSAVNQPQAEEVHPSPPSSIYSLPALYDLAFGYRDFYEEVQFLLSKHTDLVGSSPRSILEIAAGPARHSITALQLQLDDEEAFHPASVYCIDSSPEMAAYAHQVAFDEFANIPSILPSVSSSLLESNFHYHIADMRNFTLQSSSGARRVNEYDARGTQVDTIWVLLGSLQHMLTNQDVIDCFESMYKALVTNGTVFIELPHPREATFNMIECTRNGWKVPLEQKQGNQYPLDDDDDVIRSRLDGDSEHGELSIVWGDDGDFFDPITQIRNFSIRFELDGLDGEHQNIVGVEYDALNVSASASSDFKSLRSTHQVVPMRLFTAQEIDALARCAGFEVVDMFGALEDGVSVNDEDASYRLVSVLRKRQRT